MPEPVTSVFNDAYIAETYEFWLRDPNSVEESWRQFFTLAQRYGQGAVDRKSTRLNSSHT